VRAVRLRLAQGLQAGEARVPVVHLEGRHQGLHGARLVVGIQIVNRVEICFPRRGLVRPAARGLEGIARLLHRRDRLANDVARRQDLARRRPDARLDVSRRCGVRQGGLDLP
jgi:hypothetical protein